MFDNEPITKVQAADLASAMDALQGWLVRFGISNEPIEVDEAEEIAQIAPGTIFSLDEEARIVPGMASTLAMESMLVPMFDSRCEEFFVSRTPYFETPGELYPYTELVFECTHCLDSDEPGSNCDHCDGGEFIYGLTWDVDGSVTAERTL